MKTTQQILGEINKRLDECFETWAELWCSSAPVERTSGQIDALMALKWNDHDIKLKRVFDLMPHWEPLFGASDKRWPRIQNLLGDVKENLMTIDEMKKIAKENFRREIK